MTTLLVVALSKKAKIRVIFDGKALSAWDSTIKEIAQGVSFVHLWLGLLV